VYDISLCVATVILAPEQLYTERSTLKAEFPVTALLSSEVAISFKFIDVASLLAELCIVKDGVLASNVKSELVIGLSSDKVSE
jgi:hypothetical protein